MNVTDIAPGEWERFRLGLTLASPASASQIQTAEQELGSTLPDEYKEFLRKTNGAEGEIGENAYLMLWPVEDIRRLNDAYQVATYAPGYLLFGSDGGGEAFAFDLTSRNLQIVSIPFVGMSRDLAKPMGTGFWQFLDRLWRS
jgi:hypothetical protein